MHKALRSFKVTGENGQTRVVKPGDPVPEAKGWKNLAAYIRRRWITDANGVEYTGRHFVSGQRAVSVNVGGTPAPAPKAVRSPAPEPEPVAEVEPEVTEDESEDLLHTESDLEKMRKGEVVEVAESMGLDTDGTKSELIAAILEAQDG
jgi:hypothetical protein